MGDLSQANASLKVILSEESPSDKLNRLELLTCGMSSENLRSLTSVMLGGLLAEKLRADILQRRVEV